MLKILFISSLILVFFFHDAVSQSGTIASGGNASNESGSVSYSVGQVFYLSHESTEGIIHEGLQQPYEIFSVDIQDVTTEFEITLYPNPANTHLTIKTLDFQPNKLSYQLYSLNGQLIDMKEIINEETFLDVDQLNPSSYIIQVLKDNKIIKSFKLIKHSR
jgi:hypothetical protein